MPQTIASDNLTAVLGLGLTGRSCVRYLEARGQACAAFDTGISPAAAAAFRREHPEVPLFEGEFEGARLERYRRLLVSPGISLEQPAVRHALAGGAELSSDIDLLRAETDLPLVGITGSNGKTTVTTLLGEMAGAAGLRVAVGGNIGTPALDLLLSGQRFDAFVLELSSFQLERSGPLRAKAATVLNVSPDHMDRYPGLLAYQQAKQAIYRGCERAVYNRDDQLTFPLLAQGQRAQSFGLGQPDLHDYGLQEFGGERFLMRGREQLLACSALRIQGAHNYLNALAALALGEALGLAMPAMLSALETFAGVAHRCQWVASQAGVDYFNDSKATNVGATLAALKGLSRRPGDIVLIAGGVAKGADFAPLARGVEHLKALVVMGEAAAGIAAAFGGAVETVRVADMEAAVDAAAGLAQPGERVLLAPACASFDMYANFEARGDDFMRLVAARGDA